MVRSSSTKYGQLTRHGWSETRRLNSRTQEAIPAILAEMFAE